MSRLYLILCAYILDLLLGDPSWFPHPVRFIGWLATRFERFLRRLVIPEKAAGVFLTLFIVGGTWWSLTELLQLANELSPPGGAVLSVLFLWTALATRSLYAESNKVLSALARRDLVGARSALSLIVGRDTEDLNEAGIIRATVETIGENICDGIIAPLFYALLGGVPLALAYKACNTLDSMVGYKNKQYQDFGWASARLDDLLNFVPARISGLLMIAAAYLTPGLDGKGAWRIFWRDRRKHPSPNSAHGEAAMAGALGVQLGGPISYQGVRSTKPLLGDPSQRLRPEHIRQAHRLLFVTSLLGLVTTLGVGWTFNRYLC